MPSSFLRPYQGRHRAVPTSSRTAPRAIVAVAGAGLTTAAFAAGGAGADAAPAKGKSIVRTPLLIEGARGGAVRDLQAGLKVSGPGYLGDQTVAALKTFQRRHHLPVTGKADSLTWRALPKVKAPASRSADRKVGGSSLGLDSLDWAALARCESGGNPRAVNSAGYYGLYQFSIGTWRGVGGSGMPHQASAEEQTYRAQLLYKRSGARPWPYCGKLL